MKKIIQICFIGILISSCLFGDNAYVQKPLIKDYWLYWLDYKKNQKIVYCTSENVYGCLKDTVISRTVYAVGFDDRFIIAKQYPFIADSIEKSLYDVWQKNEKGHFSIKNLKDTIYLKADDTIYQEDGKWYHTENRYNYIPDSLSPYRKKTIYHIIDTRKKNRNKPYTLFTFNRESTFIEKCKKLGIDRNLKFSIADETLE